MGDDAVILMVDDNDDDVRLMQLAFEKVGLTNRLELVCNGDDAIKYLAGEGRYADRHRFPFPSLVMLDLKMPLCDGFEVLQWVKEHPQLAALPILVLSMSDRLEDVQRAYDSGANSFLVKPMGLAELRALAQAVKEFWVDRASTPRMAPV